MSVRVSGQLGGACERRCGATDGLQGAVNWKRGLNGGVKSDGEVKGEVKF